jgi:putative ABC transport system permease protein
MKDFFGLGFNNLKRRKLRTWLTMIGIFIGIAAVVSLISLGQGLQTAVTAQFASLSTDKLTVQNAGTGFGPPGSTVVEKLNEHDIRIIEGVQGVDEAIPRLIRVAKVEYNKIAQFKYITNIPEDEGHVRIIYDSIGVEVEEGRLLEAGDSGKIVLGSDVIDEDDFDKPIKIGKKIEIQGKDFEIVGILKRASTFQLNEIIIMTERDIENILDIQDEIDLIIVQIENPKDIEKTADGIERALRKDRDLKEGEEDFSVETPLEAISAVNTILNSINAVIVGIALISLLVGGIGIANTMYTSVLERRKEIGTMKAIGARNSDILVIFIIESGLLGLIGGFIGVIIGVLLSMGVAFFANEYFGRTLIVVNISLPLIISAITFSFLVGVLFGIIPSVQASKLKPVDALRT